MTTSNSNQPNSDQTIHPTSIFSGEAVMEVTATSIALFGTFHLKSAIALSNLAIDFEKNNSKYNVNTLPEKLKIEHRAYVTGTIFHSFAAVEALINEFYSAASGGRLNDTQNLDPNFLNTLATLWDETGIEKVEVLNKYQTVFRIGKKQTNKGTAEYQNVNNLRVLRNALMHFKPEPSDDLKDHKKIETELKTKFSKNPYSDSTQEYFPNQCLGAGCAEWAVKSSYAFIEDFYSRLGIQVPAELTKAHLGI